MIRCNWTEDEQSLIQSKTKWNRIVLVCDLHSAFPLMIIFAKDADGNILPPRIVDCTERKRRHNMEDAATMARSALPIGGSFARTSPSKEIKIVLPLLAAASSVDVKESCMHAMVIFEAAAAGLKFVLLAI